MPRAALELRSIYWWEEGERTGTRPAAHPRAVPSHIGLAITGCFHVHSVKRSCAFPTGNHDSLPATALASGRGTVFTEAQMGPRLMWLSS